jgi:hypothetical protein
LRQEGGGGEEEEEEEEEVVWLKGWLRQENKGAGSDRGGGASHREPWCWAREQEGQAMVEHQKVTVEVPPRQATLHHVPSLAHIRLHHETDAFLHAVQVPQPHPLTLPPHSLTQTPLHLSIPALLVA